MGSGLKGPQGFFQMSLEKTTAVKENTWEVKAKKATGQAQTQLLTNEKACRPGIQKD